MAYKLHVAFVALTFIIGLVSTIGANEQPEQPQIEVSHNED